jgi:AcrR family transcriptional regulator
MQRARILYAMAEIVVENGYARTKLKLVTSRAGVSTRAFYEHFGNLEDCFTTLLDLGTERAKELIAEAFEREDHWQDRARAALASLLVLFDSEPLLARIWFVDALAASSWALERRAHNIALLRSMIVERLWPTPRDKQPEPLIVAGIMASILGLIHTHLLTKQPTPLIDLLGPLMGLVTAPSLDTQGFTREIEKGAQLAREIAAGDPRWAPPARAALLDPGPRPIHPPIPHAPKAPRARECLLFLAEHPDSSNREIATGIGIPHKSQISRLMAHLARENLATKRSDGIGKRYAWQLTPRGEEIARVLSEQRDSLPAGWPLGGHQSVRGTSLRPSGRS